MPTCPICLHRLSQDSHTTGCNHTFCEPCIVGHLKQHVATTRTYPLRCPTCNSALRDTASLYLLRHSPEHTALSNLILENKFHLHLRYCSNPRCATPFDFQRARDLVGFYDEFKVTCPLCNTATCVNCRTQWHSGRYCDQVQHELDSLAKEKGWQRCPRCKHVIAKPASDCNHMVCRCGFQFCFSCLTEYSYIRGRPTPECSCPLWQDPRYTAQAGPSREDDRSTRKCGRRALLPWPDMLLPNDAWGGQPASRVPRSEWRKIVRAWEPYREDTTPVAGPSTREQQSDRQNVDSHRGRRRNPHRGGWGDRLLGSLNIDTGGLRRADADTVPPDGQQRAMSQAAVHHRLRIRESPVRSEHSRDHQAGSRGGRERDAREREYDSHGRSRRGEASTGPAGHSQQDSRHHRSERRRQRVSRRR